MSDVIRTVLRGIGQTLITLGVVVLLFCLYELKVTNLYTDQQQDKLDKALLHEWVQPPTGPVGPPVQAVASLGKGFARIYLPTLGSKEVHVVVEGVS